MLARHIKTMVAVLCCIWVCGACSGPSQQEFEALERRVEQLEATSVAEPADVPEQVTMSGSFVLTDLTYVNVLASGCIGRRGYEDVSSQTGVVVKDSLGAIVGASSLGNGTWRNPDCVFQFAVDVPAGLEFYTIEVGDRWSKTLSLDSLVATSWHALIDAN